MIRWLKSLFTKRHPSAAPDKPQTLDEAVDYLVTHRDIPYDHFGLGMRIRNDWGLWQHETGLGKWFADRGVYHGDDKSGMIFDALKADEDGRYGPGKPFDFEAAKEVYRQHWARAGVGMDGKPLTS